MYFAYRIIIGIYFILIHGSTPFSAKARLWVRGRKNWKEMAREFASEEEEWIWVHCSSYGEFEDIATVLEKMRLALPRNKFVLTFFSPSGYEYWKDKEVADAVMYLPKDTPSNAREFLSIFNPKLALFSRSELWPFFLHELTQRSIPSVLVGLLLSERSSFLKMPQKWMYSSLLQSFDRIYCQNEETIQLAHKKLNVQHTVLVGNCRLDRIFSSSGKESSDLHHWVDGHFCIVAGSVDDHEYRDICQLIGQDTLNNVKWIIVPHEYNPHKHGNLMGADQGLSVLYSDLEFLQDDHKILMVDEVGILRDLYSYADLAIVGGGFTRKGIHNILEPAVYHVPSIVGPRTRNYPEFKLLEEHGYCAVYEGVSALLQLICYYQDTAEIPEGAIKEVLESKLGAADAVLNDLHSNFSGMKWVK